MTKPILALDHIKQYIFDFRGMQVMVDRDLATLYQVPTKRLNEQVGRNKERFPDSFMFQLTKEEKNELIANCDRFRSMKHSSTCPHAFTEQGVAMISAVLHSKTAVEVSIQIMQAFVEMRKFISTHEGLFQRLEMVEKKQIETDQKFESIFSALENKNPAPSQGIFYDGEIFDAYIFVSELIKSAKTSIVLIDNYIDETVLQILSKRSNEVKATVYTQEITKSLQLDLDKHNSQYAPVTVKIFRKAHDRFLILDANTVYHFGASLKDVGKKWFAFSKMNQNADEMIDRMQTEAGYD
ncbi:MAG: ORF6N domain-containing protein [Gammaproteobacteria bacterium]|nr:ORF6N domain-containing protein [Gammaproteobacteria bacterium]